MRRASHAVPRRSVLLAGALALGLPACSRPTPRPSPSLSPTTPSAPAPTAPAPTGSAPARPFAVGRRELPLRRGEDRPLPVTVWYPARAGQVAAGRFPVVLFSHGLSARPEDYAPLLTSWAGAGFVVAAPTYPHTSRGAPRIDLFDVPNQPADASYALGALLELDRAAGDPLRGRLDVDRVAAAGHSAGGITTVGLFTAGRDPRLDAGIVLAGSALGVGTAFSGASAPQLFVHGERDDVVSYAAGKAAYDRVPWPKAMLSLPQGDHGGSLFDSADRRAFTVVAETTVEFLRWALYGDAAAKRRLPEAAARHGVAVLDNRL